MALAPPNNGNVRGPIQEHGLHPVAASQTIKKGDLLISDAAGRAIQAASAGALPGTGVAAASGVANRVIGIATQDASGLAVDTLISFIKALPGVTEFKFPVIHNTAGSAYPSLASLGINCQTVRVDGSSPNVDFYGLRIDSTTNAKFKIVGLEPESVARWDSMAGGLSAAGTAGNNTQYGYVWATVLETEAFFGGGW